MSRLDTLTVEIEFGAGTWTDVTGYVNLPAGISTTRGRGNAFEVPQTGSMSLTLDNTDGRFTPGSAVLSDGSANPYYPSVVENKRIRLSATHNSVQYFIFTGYIDSWVATFPGGESKRSKVAVSASDRFKLLARRQLRSVTEEIARAAGADAYYPMLADDGGTVDVTDAIRTDGAGTVVMPAFNSAATYEWSTDEKPQQQDGSLVLAGSVSDVGGAGAGCVELPALDLGTGDYEFTWAGWVRTTAAGWLFSGDRLAVVITAGSVGVTFNFTVTYGSTDVDDGEWHHVLVYTEQSGSTSTATLYIDGELQSTNSDPGPDTDWPLAPTWKLNGRDWDALKTTTDIASKVAYSRDAAYSGVILAATDLTAYAADLYEAGSYRSGGVDAADRAEQTLGWCGISGAEYDVSANMAAVLGPQDGNQSALDALQEVAAAEYAPMFVDGEGIVVFQDRDMRVTNTPAWTFDADTDIDGTALTLALADEGSVNQVTGVMWSGQSATVFISDVLTDVMLDSIGGAELNPISDTVEAPWSTLDQARDAAHARLNEKREARLRMSPVVITPWTAASDIWADVLSLEISDLFRLTGLYAATGGGSTLRDFYAESLSWDITDQEMRLTVDTTAKDRAQGDIRFDDDTTGRLTHDPGAMTVGTVSALSGTGTGTFTVVTGSGAEWTTTAGDFPLDVKIDEEEMTISGITGSSPQTFTVSVRGANGTTAAAHIAGSNVELWPIPVFAH